MRTKQAPCRRRQTALLIAAGLLCLTGTGHASAPIGIYQLTIKNTNTGQNFSPPVIILHTTDYRLFEVGQPATEALWLLAEEGATTGFKPLPETDPAVRMVLVGKAVHRRDSPVSTITFEAPSELVLSVAAMLSLTNDGFVAARSVALPADFSETTVPLYAFDAGSEANTELCAHVPCEVHGRRITDGAEGVISLHPGIRGDGDLPLSRSWTGPELGVVTITRLH